jgi:hypothetical protein
MAAPEFVYLNEQAVRVTSWNRDDTTGTIELVVIAEGEASRDQLLDIFSREPVMVRIGNGSAIPMDIRSLDTRSGGEGARSIYRVRVSLWPEGSVPPSKPAEAPIDPTQERLDRIIALLEEIRDGLRSSR